MSGDWCGHCGRTDSIMGSLSMRGGGWKLCHANPDGTKSSPDCYHLVTTGQGSARQPKLA